MDKVLRFGACTLIDPMMKMDSNVERLNKHIREDLAYGLSREIVKAIEDKSIKLTMTPMNEMFGCGINDTYSIELMVATPEAFEAEIKRRVFDEVQKYKSRVASKVDELKEAL